MTYRWGIGMVRSNFHLIGTVSQIRALGIPVVAAFMTAEQVEDCKEGFPFRSVHIVRTAATLIPYIRETTAVIGGLGIIGTVISRLSQYFCITVYEIGSRIVTCHILIPVGCSIYTSEYGIPGRVAHRAGGIGFVILKPLSGKSVQVRGSSKFISIRTQVISRIIFAGDPEYVRKFFRFCQDACGIG
jgi:hypothetical protein